MKALLWLVLSAAVVVNVFTSVAFDGVQQIVMSVGTGVLTLACAGALWVKRDRQA
ncbi:MULTISPECIES: hypothetical protein [unclassified Streptomyces]|uniref:hypothetical protein n=1 Tax=unclassified Streptomyces TaxID=2593676 RepID=UPI002DD8F4B4|nr:MULTISPECIES: hypothetical protein [unclassified Streptomyces]WSA93389.1 hypothetical protein OIE63_18725 [Streptomyces sp. NBC_01795]WSB77758.1 hypothetical protein OHB04_19555 [Streptomyces sp. NBC_01775]WSS13994.1 hypothetical protein OG533_20490 [Streptomyces sp. NBC_01186]WSS42814.1 hypothetical protein OG220_21195 [Streptomyces sp. NBC_01187]